MKVRVALIVIASALVTLVPAPSARSATVDWTVLRFTASRSVRFDLEIFGWAEPNRDRTLVLGMASGLTGPGARPSRSNWRRVEVFGGKGSVDVAASAQDRGARRRAGWPPELRLGQNPGFIELWPSVRLSAGQTYAVAVFAPGGRIAYLWHTAVPAGVQVVARRGSGSTAVRTANVRQTGGGIEAGPLGAGALVHSVKASRGLVGAVAAACDCAAHWRGPGGRQGYWAAADAFAAGPACWCSGIVGAGSDGFAGPAGSWRLTWAGLTGVRQTAFTPLHGMSSPVVAAYAPIGDDWRYFTGTAPLL